MNRPAYGLISALMAVSLALLCGLAISREAAQNIIQSRLRNQGTKVFYLAESGLEHSKSIINSDNSWFTETDAVNDSKNRLLASSAGEIHLFGHGGYKIIRENGKNRIYSIGFVGTDLLKSPAFSFQRMDFELPYKTTKWEEF